MLSPTEIEVPSAYNTLHVGVALYDPDTGAILDGNDWVEAIFGYTTEELRDLSIEEYTANTYPHSEAEFKDHLQASAAGDPQQFTWRVKRADGELIWVQIHLSRQTATDQTCVCAEVRDITDFYETHHRAELFWRVLRHNLRNEATIIAGNATRITANAETAQIQDAGRTIQARAESLGTMAASVEEIEQAVADTDTQRVRRHATSAVREGVDEIVTDYPTAGITIDEREKMGIHVDDAFTHAVTHAVENAIVHSTEAEPVVEVSIGPSPNTGRVEIRIKDTNPPIPDDELTALFTPTDTTNTSHGSGVGLFVMKWCIESLGGEMKVERRHPQGNTIYFYLPPKAPPDRK